MEHFQGKHADFQAGKNIFYKKPIVRTAKLWSLFGPPNIWICVTSCAKNLPKFRRI